MHDRQPLRRVTVRGFISEGVAHLRAEVPLPVARRWKAEAKRLGFASIREALKQHLIDCDRTRPAAEVEEIARAFAEGAEHALAGD